MSMKLVATLGVAVLNCLTTPPCSTTNQRELSAGACSIAIEALKLKSVKRVSEIEPVAGRAHATQVAFDGRESMPETPVGVVGGGVVGGEGVVGGVEGGGCESEPP